MMRSQFPFSRVFFALLAAALLAGCTSAEYTRTPRAGAYEAYHGGVAVLTDFPTDGHFARLGVVTARRWISADEEDLIEALQDKAAAQGADAIVLQGRMRVRETADGTAHELAAFAIRRAP